MEKEICWNITARCNQNCKYCHRFLNIKDLSFEENKTILNNLIASGVESITWTGGEALLIDGLDELLKISHNNNIKNKIITNGKLLTKDKIDKIIKYLDSITLSIDSIDNTINEVLGRGKNHYNEIKEILDYIKEKNYNIKIRINSVVCKCNLNSFNALVEIFNNYNIYSWRIFKFMPLREKAIVNQKLFDISDKEYSDIVDYIKCNSNIKNIESRVREDMQKKYILILADGSIVVTNNDGDKVIGNALNDSLNIFV